LKKHHHLFHYSLQEIHDERCCATGGVKRSNSLPMPGCDKTPEGKLGRKNIATIFNTDFIGFGLNGERHGRATNITVDPAE
jgi:hypothetical protein